MSNTPSLQPSGSAPQAAAQATNLEPSEHNTAVMQRCKQNLKAGEPVRWDCCLYDSDGFAHSLVDIGGVQVVTRQSFAYAVWDRRTGECVSHAGLWLTNARLSDAQRQAKHQLEMGRLHAEAAAPAFLQSCRTVDKLLKAVECAVVALPAQEPARAALLAACAPFREGVAAAFYSRGDMQAAARDGEEVEAADLDQALERLVENFPHPWEEMSGFLRAAQAERQTEAVRSAEQPPRA